TGELRLASHAGLSPELIEQLSMVRVGDAPGGLAARRRVMVVIEDLAESPYQDAVWTQHGYHSFVSVPLQCKGMLLGCLTMASSQTRPFEDADREMLTLLASQIGMAVGNADLYKAAQRKIEYLSALHQCSQDI